MTALPKLLQISIIGLLAGSLGLAQAQTTTQPAPDATSNPPASASAPTIPAGQLGAGESLTSLAPLPSTGPPPPIPTLPPVPITSAVTVTAPADVPVTGGAPAATKQIAKPYATKPPVTPGAPITTPDTQTGPTMTLDQVVNEVLTNNPTVVQARLAAQAARAEIGEATGQGLPQVHLDGSDTYSSYATSGSNPGAISTITPVIGQVPGITDSSYNSLQTGVSQSLSGNTTPTLRTTGEGSSTATTSSTTTIVPVTSLSGGSSSSGSSTIAPASSSNSSGSSGISPGSFGTTGSATPQNHALHARPQATTGTGTTGTGTTGTGTTLPNGAVVASRGQHNNYGAAGTVTQYLDVFGMLRANISIAKKNALFYDLDDIRIENDTILNAKDTYYAVIRAQSDVTTAEEQLKNSNAILHDAEVQYQAGAEPQYDVISAQAEVSAAEEALINAHNNLDIERSDLNNLLNRNVDAPVTLAPANMYVIPTTTPVDREIAAAYQGRPELQQATLAQDIAGNETKLARQGQLPSLGLSGSAEYEPSLSSAELGGSDFSEEITATIDIPLFDGGQTAARVKAARIAEANQRSVNDQLAQDIALEVRTALSNVIDGQALVSSDQSAVAENKEALREANIRYTSGVGTLLEVTNAEADLASAEDNLNAAVYEQQSAYAALQRAEGKR